MASVRATDVKTNPTPERLSRVPPAPKSFSKKEKETWTEIAKAAVRLGTLAATDLRLLGTTARIAARLDALLANPKSLPAQIGALARIEEMMLRNFGLSPLSRRGVAPLPETKNETGGDDLDGL